MNIPGQLFRKVSKKQCADFGQVLVLVCILLAIYSKDRQLMIAAFGLLLTSMLFPLIYYPFARIWFGLSAILAAVSSHILLTVVFIVLIIPVGLVRKMAGRDSLKLKKFGKDRSSVMIIRNHLYVASDLENTF